jgi:hypothetical protein
MNSDDFFGTDQIKSADNKVEIIDLTAEPYIDQSRVKIHFRLSFFQDPPNAKISLFGGGGEELTSVDIVNIIHPDNEITLHLPNHTAQQGNYQVDLTLFSIQEHDTQTDEEGQIELATQMITSRQTTFTLA